MDGVVTDKEHQGFNGCFKGFTIAHFLSNDSQSLTSTSEDIFPAKNHTFLFKIKKW